jgi:uncharacterized protein (TIGR00266 family)
MKYDLIGDDMQAVVCDLEAGESLRAEAGVMMMMTQSIRMQTTANTSEQKGMMGSLMSGLKRVIAGESFFITVFHAEGQPGRVIFSAPYPGKIIHLSLSATGPMLCQRDTYLCSETTVDIQVAFTKRLGAGFFGGEGFILQKLTGTGQAFVHAGGAIYPMDLAPGETLRVDTGCLVAFTESVDYDIQMVSGIKTALFGGEGLFFAQLTGPGRVYLQTLPFGRMADRIIAASKLGAGAGAEQSRGFAGIGGDLVGGLFSGD